MHYILVSPSLYPFKCLVFSCPSHWLNSRQPTAQTSNTRPSPTPFKTLCSSSMLVESSIQLIIPNRQQWQHRNTYLCHVTMEMHNKPPKITPQGARLKSGGTMGWYPLQNKSNNAPRYSCEELNLVWFSLTINNLIMLNLHRGQGQNLVVALNQDCQFFCFKTDPGRCGNRIRIYHSILTTDI